MSAAGVVRAAISACTALSSREVLARLLSLSGILVGLMGKCCGYVFK